MKISLFFVPQWTPSMPQLALPVLTAFLRKRGHQVRQRDLNVEIYDYMLSQPVIEEAVASARRLFGAKLGGGGGLGGLTDRRLPEPDLFQWAMAEGPALARKVEAAKAVMRGPQFYEPEASLEALLTMAQALQVASLPYFPSELQLLRFRPAHAEDSSRELLAGAQNPQINPFLVYYQKHVLPDLEADPPELVGISIPTMGQMLAGVTLGMLIKKRLPGVHVTVGGPHITMLRESLMTTPQIFQAFDSAVIGEGEIPLAKLVDAITEGGDLASVPNLVYRNPATGQVCMGPKDPLVGHSEPVKVVGGNVPVKVDPLEDLPDFDGLPLEKYLAPGLILPLLTADGCYHGKCAFCNVGYGWLRSNFYHQFSAEHIVARMLELNRKYGAKHIFFADEAISARNLRGISTLLEAQGSPIHWCGCVRFDNPLSAELLQQVSRGGGRMLMFGLETASEPIVKHMEKGTRVETTGRILNESTAAGIWNHTFFFFGFPGETIDNAQETVNFIYAHQHAIHSASPGTFLLERYAPAHLRPQDFSIRKVIESPERDLAIYYDYEADSGMDENTAELLVERLLSVVPKKRYGQYYIHDSYRLLYAGRLHEEGKPFPPWLIPETH